jgi:hypothetical protein
MRRVFYLPLSSTSLSTPALRESMRRFHWHQCFLALKAHQSEKSMYHRKLALSITKAPDEVRETPADYATDKKQKDTKHSRHHTTAQQQRR